MANTPDSIKAYEHEYHPQAWEQYSLAELGWWVHLFAKRAEHRTDREKRAKDLLDASNYLAMMASKLEEIKRER